jgi:Zn-dependent protease
MDEARILDAVMKLGVLVFSLCLHEFGHAYAAYRLGDPTAKMLGRMTIDPRAHVDPFGTILFPMIMFLTQSPFMFGWAKPVPVTVENFNKPRWNGALVALAGPAMNVLLALLSLGFLVLMGTFSSLGDQATFMTVGNLAQFFLSMNVALAVFNLIPVYPLDGSWILKSILPPKWSYQVSRLDRYGYIILFAVFFLLRGL